jgi:hypothetical protein
MYDTHAISIAQNAEIDLIHRLITDVVSSRRLSTFSLFQSSYNVTNFIISNNSLPILPSFDSNVQVLHALTFRGFIPFWLGNSYLSINHPTAWLGDANARTFNQRVSETFIRVYHRHPVSLSIGLFTFGIYVMYKYPGLKIVLKY